MPHTYIARIFIQGAGEKLSTTQAAESHQVLARCVDFFINFKSIWTQNLKAMAPLKRGTEIVIVPEVNAFTPGIDNAGEIF